MHANKDGLLTLEEMQAFMRGNQTISSPAIGARLSVSVLMRGFRALAGYLESGIVRRLEYRPAGYGTAR
jgi:hypothetical protein